MDFTIPSEPGKTSTSATTELPPLPDIHDGNGNRPKVTTLNPNAVTTLPLTNIETDAVTTLTEQERQENATTPLINDATDLASDATEDSITVGETDIFTEIQTSNAGIASSTAEDIVSITTAQTGLVTHMLVTELTTAEDITEVVTDVVLTTGALDTTEATEVVTETVSVSLAIPGTQEAGTTLETGTVGETDVDMTSVVELESAVPTDEVTIPPGSEKTSAAIETTELPPLPDTTTNRHDQGNLKVTTPRPNAMNAVTTLPLTNIETDPVTTATEQEIPENATTPPFEPLQTTSSQTTVPTTELTTRTSTPLATTIRKVISAPRHMEASEMGEDEMKNVVSLQFKGITVSNVIVSFRYESC